MAARVDYLALVCEEAPLGEQLVAARLKRVRPFRAASATVEIRGEHFAAKAPDSVRDILKSVPRPVLDHLRPVFGEALCYVVHYGDDGLRHGLVPVAGIAGDPVRLGDKSDVVHVPQ